MDGLLPQSHHKTLLLDYQLPAHLQELEKLAAAVEEALPEHPDLAFSVNLCLDELITNTILHGLQGAQNRLIRVRMNISAQLLEIFIKDDAPHFDPFLQAPIPDLDLDLDERQVGGLGVHLVKTLMDDVRTYYDGSGNLIVLLKTLRKEA
ncbi:ATP-binding protein [Giesbergeria anulus]|uniref:Serine/threonine-protein kinase RsbW n=1 Tax=Giesbergeria anulus TaxID=180197 RepID=A0A1H9LMR0_9BURK|nr:ATP-binding protein [Giesbergeria anulus]SER12193.1 serine/threonine-protein kinase RsbW [Giesbergeria anulus]